MDPHARQLLRSDAYRYGAAALFLAVGTIIAALLFEHVGGHVPCPLCLEQRTAYYLGVPALFGALVVLAAIDSRLAAAILALTTLGFLYNAGLGAYHAGVEWSFWVGPTTCEGAPGGSLPPLATNSGDLLKSLQQGGVARCDAPSWRLFGLSFAGWNALISLAIAILAGRAAIAALRRESA